MHFKDFKMKNGYSMIKRIVKHFLTLLKPKRTNHRRIFSSIYSDSVWGSDDERQFYSGTGSNDAYAEPYAAAISKFINEHKIKSVVDLGCGDFRVGKKIVGNSDIDYIGIDVVPKLIDYNNKTFGSKNVNFLCKNVVRQKIPNGELCLIRQVLQHLSNADIQKVLKKCEQFKYLIVTEHLPVATDITANIDKPSNEHIRLNINSGVYLEKSPFNKHCVELLTVFPEQEKDSKIVTIQVVN